MNIHSRCCCGSGGNDRLLLDCCIEAVGRLCEGDLMCLVEDALGELEELAHLEVDANGW